MPLDMFGGSELGDNNDPTGSTMFPQTQTPPVQQEQQQPQQQHQQHQQQQKQSFTDFGASPPQGFATDFSTTTPPSGVVGAGGADPFAPAAAQPQKMPSFEAPAVHQTATPATTAQPPADPFGGGNTSWAAF